MNGYCSCTQDTKERYWEQQFCQMEKGHFSPTDRNDQTGQSGLRRWSQIYILVGPNRNGPFHLISNRKFPKFWAEWKAPVIFKFEDRISCFRAKAQLVFHWCLYNKNTIVTYKRNVIKLLLRFWYSKREKKKTIDKHHHKSR